MNAAILLRQLMPAPFVARPSPAHAGAGNLPGVVLTSEAARAVAALCAEGGPVAFVEPIDGFGELLCLGRADLMTSVHDLLIGEVIGCPVYVDRRARRVRTAGPLVIDASDDPDGPRFVLRPRTCGRAALTVDPP